jgi:TPR repeat protein
VTQDFHLAKRYYDQAADADHKAKAPRDIALLLLEVRMN